MVHRNIYDIEIPRYIWQPSKPTKRVFPNIAFDTETGDGYVYLIADSNGRKLALKGLKEYLEFLSHKKYRSTVNWFYNLTYDTNALLKFLTREQRKEIVTFNKIDVHGFRISIIPNKELQISTLRKDDFDKDGIRKIKDSTFFYDLAQFYDFKPLKTLAAQVAMEKVEVADISNIDWEKYLSDFEYGKLIDARCVIDCEITVALADKLTKEINKMVVINKYKSKASIARKYVLENLKKKLDLPDYGLLQSSLDSYHAGYIETTKMGLFKNIYNADINSAYPNIMRNLYETSGVYKRNREYEPDASYSFYLVFVEYDNEYLSPLWYNQGGNNYHATGTFNTWITKSEYEYLMKMGYDVVIEKAYHIIKDKDAIKPFENVINDLYERRLQAKKEGDDIQKVIKVILNSMYGVTINTVLKYDATEGDTDIWAVNAFNELVFYKNTFKATNMYNPLFATDITAQTRMKIFNDFEKDYKDINAVSTDGIYLSKKPKGVTIDEKMGNYSLKKIPKYMLLGSGRYIVFDGDAVDDKESRFRSISMKPSQMYGIMDVNREKQTIDIEKTKVIKIKESLKNSNYYNLNFSKFPIQDYYEKDLFNTFQQTSKKINFFESRRKWFNQFSNIQDIFDTQISSRPYDVSELEG